MRMKGSEKRKMEMQGGERGMRTIGMKGREIGVEGRENRMMGRERERRERWE